jgi:hypothetical protein
MLRACRKWNAWSSTRSTLQPEPKRDQLPHAFTLPLCPALQVPSARLALTALGRLELTKLFRDVKWIGGTAFTIEKVVLSGKLKELGKVFPACGRADARTARKITTMTISTHATSSIHRVGDRSRSRGRDDLDVSERVAAHGLDECDDSLMNSFLS